MAELSDEQWRADVQGRLVAAETILTGLLTLNIGTTPAPMKNLEKVRRSFFASLQNMERPIGEEYDLIWEYATKALGNYFDNAAVKIENIEKRLGTND